MTVREALRVVEQQLTDARIPSPEVDARVLLAHAIGESPTRIPLLTAASVDAESWGRLGRLVQRRASREPLAYVVGETEFMGLRFRCDKRVLVPRQDTETLVEAVIAEVGGEGMRQALLEPVIADIGTGSGCIAISLAHFLPSARLIATDISADALELARGNASLNGVADRVEFVRGADLEPVLNTDREGTVDVVVCNPPYVALADQDLLQPEVACHEPELALYGGQDGLDAYRRLVPELTRLSALRLAAFEISYDQSETVSYLVRQAFPGWTVELHQDLSGTPRVVTVRRQE